MKSSIVSILDRLDQKGVKYVLQLIPNRSSLIILLLHSLFKHEEDISRNIMAPQQGMTVDLFEQIIDHFLEINSSFILPPSSL